MTDPSPLAPSKPASAGKILLILAVVSIAGLGLLIGAGVLFARFFAKDMNQGVQAQTRTGAQYGTGRDADACLEKGVSNSKDCFYMNLSCLMKNQFFINGCLGAASGTSKLCQEVPAPTSILDAATHQRETCAKFEAAANQSCHHAVAAVQQYCAQ